MAVSLAASAALLVSTAAHADDEMVGAASGVTVESDVIQLGWMESAPVPELWCPEDHHRMLSETRYHVGSGWRIPEGVELRTGENIDAIVLRIEKADPTGIWVRQGVGGFASTVTNWSLGDSWFQVVLHCGA